jgi:D-alanyl-D-alanine carboxypeptidase (penicillin-binding protein 5/6)
MSNYHDEVHKSGRRKRRIVALCLVILTVSAGVYLPITLLSPLPPAVVTVQKVAPPSTAAASIVVPGIGASAVTAVGYPTAVRSGGSTSPLPIASISKVVTVLVALEAKPLATGETGPTVTFGTTDAALFGKYTALNGTAEPMPAGSHLSELDLLRVVLIASANNYADKLASWSYGSTASFISATTSWLKTHGLSHTTIVEPTGINPKNTSTPTDLIELGKLALANPVLASIVSTKSISLPIVGTFHNTNALLGQLGVDGIKSGTLDNIGSNLLFASDYNIGGKSIRIIGAIVGATDHDTLYAAVKALLASVRNGFHVVKLANAGETFASYSTRWNTRVNAVAAQDASTVLWSDTPITSKVVTLRMATAAKGSAAGSVTFTAGKEVVAVALVLNHAILAPSAWWRLGHPALLAKP